MKNILTILRTVFVSLVLAMVIALGFITQSQAGTYEVDGNRVIIQAFTKSATRVCDKITYSFHVYINTNGGPTHVAISDVWPNGLVPASAVSISGSTAPANLVTTVNAAGWNVAFDTPPGAGTVVTSYVLSFTSTIDAAALAGGDFKMVNQAKIALGKDGKQGEVSDDPSAAGLQDKTVLNIPVVEVKACMPPPTTPPAANSCLDGKAEVTCGKIYGTYNITLKPKGVGGVIPTSVSITSLTPGVTVSPVLASYPVVGGQVTITVVGATPGQTLNFNVAGTTAGGGSVEGTNLCCNGKISVTIPKDLNCPPPPPHVAIKKYCDPVIKGRDGVIAGGYSSICHIKVSTTGNIALPINISEVLTAPGTVAYVSTAPATDPWVCVPSPATAPAPMNCTLPPNIMTGPSDVSIIDVKVSFPNLEAANKALNCAEGSYNGESLKKFCTHFHYGDGKVEIEKKCDALHASEGYPPLGGGFVTRCKITVHTTGTVTYPLNVAEVLSGIGTVDFVSLSPPSVWTCTPFTVAAPTPINCVANGGLNNTSSTSEFEFDVHFPNTAAANESTNCGVVTDNVHPSQKSCVPFGIKDTVTIEKKCDAAMPVGDVKITGYQSMCHITVKTTGSQTGTLNVNDVLSGAGNLGTASAPAPWSCTSSNCQVNGSLLNQTSSTSVIDIPVNFPLGNAGGLEAKNCAQAFVNGQPAGESCDRIVITGEYKFGTLSVTKEASYNGTHITNVAFPITVTCGADVSSGSIQDSAAPFVKNPIPLGTQCTVLEGTSPATGLCPKGTTEHWTTSYTPTGSVIVSTPTGTTIAVRNMLDCQKDETGKIEIKKVCEPATPNQTDGSNYGFHTICHITVTTTGPIANPGLTVGDVVLPTNVAPHLAQVSGPAWVCDYRSCSATPAVLGASSTSVFDTYIDFPDAGSVAEEHNCASTTGADKVEGCSRFTLEQPTDSDMYIKKVVVNHAPGSVAGMVFDITSQCTNTTQPTGFAHFVDSQVVLFHHYEAGMSCNLSEYIPPTTACGADTPVWTTTYSQPSPVALSPNGETIIVTNTLDCTHVVTPVDGNPIKVKKVVINNAPLPVGDLQFPITVTCVKGTNGEVLDNDATHTVADGQTITYLPYAEGFSCSAHEGAIPQTDACGKNMKPVWNTSYSAQPVPMMVAGETITVTNLLKCVPIIIDHADCPPRTHYDPKSGKCLDDRVVCVAPFVLNPDSNTCYIPKKICPAGTHLEGKICVANQVKCAPPAVRNPTTNTCYVPRPDCGPGTHWDGRNCVPNRKECRAPLKLNPNTNTCYLPKPDCPAGTHWNGKRCVGDVVNCQAGTHLEGNKCVRNRDVQKCGPRQIQTKRGCISIPQCAIGQLPVPGTGMCVDLFHKREPKGPVDGQQPRGGGLKIPGLGGLL
jgi:hypothetical protein